MLLKILDLYKEQFDQLIHRADISHSVDAGWLNVVSDVLDTVGIVSIVGIFTGKDFITGEIYTKAERDAALINGIISIGSLAFAGAVGMGAGAVAGALGAPDELRALITIGTAMGAGYGLGKITNKNINKAVKGSDVVGSVEDGFKRLNNLDDFADDIMKTKPKNSPTPENWLKKGGSIEFDDATGAWKYTDMDGNAVIYRDGYPDFTPYKHPDVDPVPIEIHQPKNNGADFKAANEGAGLGPNSNPPVYDMSKPPKGYTWHHMEDGKTMILVKEDIHDLFKHRGGQSIVNGKGAKQK